MVSLFTWEVEAHDINLTALQDSYAEVTGRGYLATVQS